MQHNFTLLSFNVLSQSNLSRHQRELYSQSSPQVLRWEWRRDLIIKEILSKTPDIVCLQEVDNEYFEDYYSPVLSQSGFSGQFKPRRLNVSKTDGLAIFYRTSKFKLLGCHAVDLNKRDGILKWDNVALIAVLAPVFSGNGITDPTVEFDPIIVATTHLVFSPRGDVKLAQLAVIFAELDGVIGERTGGSAVPAFDFSCPRLPVVVCGDMNFEPYCSIFDFVVNGRIKYGGVDIQPVYRPAKYQNQPLRKSSDRDGSTKYFSLLPRSVGITEQCRKKRAECSIASESPLSSQPINLRSDGMLYHSLHLKSTYHMHYQTSQRENVTEQDVTIQPESEFMTTHHDLAANTVDYIFFNESPTFQLNETYPIPRIGHAPKIPNEVFGSDHFSVAANFTLYAHKK